MHKLSLLAGVLALAGAALPGQAFAACSGNMLNHTELHKAFAGNTVCASRGADRWQEFHRQGGALIDYKKGPSDRVDPTRQVGSWAIDGTGNGARMMHDYGKGGVYRYQVYRDGGRYSFCSGNQSHDATVRSGQQSCGF
ncbi:MAG: hypothetical protein ABTQ28_08575 [Thauera sp.]|jgi:hypothetical protein